MAGLWPISTSKELGFTDSHSNKWWRMGREDGEREN